MNYIPPAYWWHAFLFRLCLESQANMCFPNICSNACSPLPPSAPSPLIILNRILLWPKKNEHNGEDETKDELFSRICNLNDISLTLFMNRLLVHMTSMTVADDTNTRVRWAGTSSYQALCRSVTWKTRKMALKVKCHNQQ